MVTISFYIILYKYKFVKYLGCVREGSKKLIKNTFNNFTGQ